ncbi:glutamate-1-semialdehyde 2,1-aminomutase [Ekhidna sp. To15]|uniref:glutamate-1-semialdehyde 2,1-aminomutase n=1 Tax=Ekhidna sp. To15 TaxID=3395267 RepID=UPI003F520F78
MKIATSKELFDRAKDYIPGGVNSPVRAFKAVGGDPIFFAKAEGAYMYDEDGNSYIDLINSWGPMILGHANKQIEEAIFKAVIGSPSFGAPSRMEVELAELINEMVPSIEKVRMVNSGTEATMSAIRLARGFTKRDKVLKFEGCYHGHGDSFLIAAGSGAMTMGEPDSPGVTKGTAQDTLLAPYNNIEKVKEVLASNQGEIAAIIVEPVAGNMGCVLPEPGFLEGLRTVCDEDGILLIFDEVMTGFRLAKGGAQEVYGVKPDLTTLGKIIGAGMPVGAYGGRSDVMDFVSPQGPVYQAGTLSGNPVAMAAGYAQLSYLNDHPEVYENIEKAAKKIMSGYEKALKKHKLKYTMNQIGSMISLFFTDKKVVDFKTAKSCDTELFGKYFRHMLNAGVYLAPSQFESLFISNCIGDNEIGQIVSSFEDFLKAEQGR